MCAFFIRREFLETLLPYETAAVILASFLFFNCMLHVFLDSLVTALTYIAVDTAGIVKVGLAPLSSLNKAYCYVTLWKYCIYCQC